MKWKELNGEARYSVVQMAREGKVPIKALCRSFGVSRQSLKTAMDKADQAAMEALIPKSPGRKGKSKEQVKAEAVKKEKDLLEKELDHWKQKYEIAMTFVEIHKKLLNREAFSEEPQEPKRPGKKRNAKGSGTREVRRQLVRTGLGQRWARTVMAEVMGVKYESLKRYIERLEGERPVRNRKLGRPPAVPAEVRLKIRNCYIEHYKQWGPRTLSDWCRREGLGDYSPTTISSIIDDIRDRKPPKDKPRRYEITAPSVMWSEDGAGFRDYGRKRELLILQDECSRYKVNKRLVKGPANSDDVYDYLREAFDKYGAPLVLKHDGDSIFHEERVHKLLDEYGVINLKSPARYPPFNGKMERSIRDIKSYERAMRRFDSNSTLQCRIEAAIHDLNEERPRPVLGGRTAREVFEGKCRPLPDRERFFNEIMKTEQIMLSESCTRKQKDNARRRAVELVLLRQGLIKEITDVSTYLKAKTRTI